MWNKLLQISYDFLARKREIFVKDWDTFLMISILCILFGASINYLFNKRRIDILKEQAELAEKKLVEKNESIQKYELEIKQLTEENNTLKLREQPLNWKEYALDLVDKLNQFAEHIKKEEHILSLNKSNEEDNLKLLYNFRHRKSKEYRDNLKYEVKKVRCILLKESNNIEKVADYKDSLAQEILDTSGYIDIEQIKEIKNEIETLARLL
ncbi:hypothetical protein [Anabaena sp. UHCC 0204]|uniref:hypothetical protein n=1 Tax=Anabaena sp. UHCC 0204 TaxID=2590009 RepID=UPI001445AB2B|nr:hypothetical protein [Anabaena sp. UHCC 0204]MTJ06747.1 hypothetical protein [Anabaena sp. UHCC 0204]